MADAHEVNTDDDHADAPTAALATIPDYSTLPPARVPTPMGVVAVVAVKMVGLYCFVHALPLVYMVPADLILMTTGAGLGPVDAVVNLLHPVAYLALGIALVRGAAWVATRVLGFEEPSDPPRVRAPSRRVQAIAFSVVGLWFVATGLADVVWIFTQAHRDSRIVGGDVIESAFEDPATLARVTTELGLGVWLFFGSKRLALFWHRLRMQPVPAHVEDR